MESDRFTESKFYLPESKLAKVDEFISKILKLYLIINIIIIRNKSFVFFLLKMTKISWIRDSLWIRFCKKHSESSALKAKILCLIKTVSCALYWLYLVLDYLKEQSLCTFKKQLKFYFSLYVWCAFFQLCYHFLKSF